ncbi:MAG: hypothetical protein V5A68_04945 [Candidatus Thermoplasmatota archaeon]
MANRGCFTRGVVLLLLKGDKVDVDAAIGANTKRNPKKAVKSVKKNLNSEGKFVNNVLVEFASTAVIPKIPGVGQKNVILSKLLGNILLKLMPLLTKFNYGYDRADEVLDYLSEIYDDRLIIGGCTMDDNKMLRNYQFYNNQIKEKFFGNYEYFSSK